MPRIRLRAIYLERSFEGFSKSNLSRNRHLPGPEELALVIETRASSKAKTEYRTKDGEPLRKCFEVNSSPNAHQPGVFSDPSFQANSF